MQARGRTIQRHAVYSKRDKKRVNITNDLNSDKPSNAYCLDSKVAVAEITLAALVCARNFSFNSVNY